MQVSTAVERFVTREVLFETDGPEVVLAAAGGRPWIGVASDYERAVMRWVYTPVSSVEVQAVKAGAEDLHECFRKPKVVIVDEHPDTPDTFFEADGRELDEATLPRLGLLLPRLSGMTMNFPFPEISFAHEDNRPGLPARPFADVVDMLQRLYHAIAQALFDGKTTATARITKAVSSRIDLELLAAAPGSLRLKVQPPEAEAFQKVNEQLSALLRTQGDGAHDLFESLGVRVYGRYGDLLELLEGNSLHMLLSAPGSPAIFMAPHIASRRLGALPAQTDMIEPPFWREGLLLGFDPGASAFTFYDIREDREIRGRISGDLVQPRALQVGEDSPPVSVRLRRKRVAMRRGAENVRFELLEVGE